MGQLTVQQMRGIQDLVQTAINETTSAIEDAQHDIARKPYAVMERIWPIAGTAGIVEDIQVSVTKTVYHSIRTATSIIGKIAALALDQLEKRESAQCERAKQPGQI